ncbi:hypothetical protein [Oryzomonas rubra]|uniref:Uncharacterized protein n=1 Tax=Oryzomonas rubra TaxID=2509454 RepID=A0A5A9X6S9_9BACT|nr:hypothetical protein [Oryzomonas rubra]KAA0888075.1 hypothetical protein ET418_16885 [Oryzomonas rubra]
MNAPTLKSPFYYASVAVTRDVTDIPEIDRNIADGLALIVFCAIIYLLDTHYAWHEVFAPLVNGLK